MAATINGIHYDGGQIELNIEGKGEIRGINSISYGYGRETSKVKGVGDRYLGQTRGYFIVSDVTLNLYTYELNNLEQYAGGPKELTELEFEIVIKYTDSNDNRITHVISDCRITDVATSIDTQSADATTVDLTISATNLTKI